MVDFFLREGGAVLSWWVIALFAGVAAYPLVFRLAGTLPSRGYALARAAGLMLVGFVFWMLNILGLAENTPGSTVLAAAIVLTVGLVSHATWRERDSIREWLRANGALIVTVELLFAALFVGWVLVRALNPNLLATEKPMEMAFLSAVRRSATFPPHDPWMSGYAISYYHFGYIIVGMVANLSGVNNGMAFNLALPLLFGLTGIGAFGIAYDLVVAHLRRKEADKEAGKEVASEPRRYSAALAVGVMAAILAVVMGNLGTVFVEVPYQTCAASPAYLSFMGLEERDSYPPGSTDSNCLTSKSLNPADWNYWWWFRYSRVIRDRDLSGAPIVIQPISEFPNFSYVLSDMHPHVLAMPFAMLAIGLALALALRRRELTFGEYVLYAVYVGGMIFLNSWDAVYLGLLVGAEGLRRLLVNGTGRFTNSDWWGVVRFGAIIALLTAVLYSPFFISFRSQAGGIVPNVLWPTQFQQFFLMFGPFLVIITGFLLMEWRRAGQTFNTPLASSVLGISVIMLVLVLIVIALVAWARPDIRATAFQTVDQSGGLLPSLLPIAVRRVEGFLTQGLLLFMIFVVVGRLFAREPITDDGAPGTARQIATYSPATGFVLLLIAAGAVLTLAPEFVYLRDDFGVRINTVFKLYYQGWLMWSVASAFGLWSLLSLREAGRARDPLRVPFAGVAMVLIVLCMAYPVAAIWSRGFREGGHLNPNASVPWTLDDAKSLAVTPDDYAAIQCLARTATSDSDVVMEAHDPRIAYNNQYGRVSGLSGIPTLLGWQNHERQWRGSTYDAAAAGRAEDVARLYNTLNWPEVAQVVQKYKITYIYVGPTERKDYNPQGIAKFDPLTPICRSGDAAVYSVDSLGLQNLPKQPTGN